MGSLSLLALSLFLSTSTEVQCDEAKGDVEKLQGTWQATEAVGNGKTLPKEELQHIKMVFAGDKLTFFPLGGEGKQGVEYTLKVDPTKTPKAMDWTRREGAAKGLMVSAIYELSGETLKVCMPIGPSTKERPTKFDAPEKSNLVLVTLKKVKG